MVIPLVTIRSMNVVVNGNCVEIGQFADITSSQFLPLEIIQLSGKGQLEFAPDHSITALVFRLNFIPQLRPVEGAAAWKNHPPTDDTAFSSVIVNFTGS